MKNLSLTWLPISTAPIDGTEVWVYTAPHDGLPEFEGWSSYHPDVGWCTDKLRTVTHWSPGTKHTHEREIK